MGRPQVLSPIAHNAPIHNRTRSRSGVLDGELDQHQKTSKALRAAAAKETQAANGMGDKRGGDVFVENGASGDAHQRSQRRPVGRQASSESRPDNYSGSGSSRTKLDDTRRKSGLGHSGRRGSANVVATGPSHDNDGSSSAPPRRRAPSGLAASAAADTHSAQMSLDPASAGVWASSSGGAQSKQAREDGHARSMRGEAVRRRALVDSSASASSASSASSRHSTDSAARHREYGPSEDSDGAGSASREEGAEEGEIEEHGHIERTPTLLRRTTVPQPQGRQAPLRRLMSNQQTTTTRQGAKSKEQPQRALSSGVARPQTPEAQARRRITRQAIVEILSPMRAMRVARAGMKRKHGDGARSTGLKGQPQHKGVNGYAVSTEEEAFDAQNKGVGPSRLNASVSSGEDEPETLNGQVGDRPRHTRKVSRDVSSAHLRRNMRALALSDKDDGSMPPVMTRKSSTGGRSTRTSSRTSSFQRRISAGSSSRSSRKRSEQMSHEPSTDGNQGGMEGTAFGDEDVHEIERLLHQAPTWQLNRLNKTQLQTLHVRLGTWQASENVDLDLFSKQDLVEGIIKSRSVDAKPTTPLTSSTSYISGSCDTSMRSRRRSSATLSHSVTLDSLASSLSSEYTDESGSEDKSEKHFQGTETDANDAGGEETEVEPSKLARQKGKGKASASAAASPILHRLRHAHSRYKLHGNGAHSATSAASSSRIQSNKQQQQQPQQHQQTRTTYIATSPTKRRLRHQPSVAFAAASPVPTRARARNQSSSSSSRHPRLFQQRTLRTNANGELSIGEAMQMPYRRQARAKTTASTSVPNKRKAAPAKTQETDLADDSSQGGNDSAFEGDEDLSDHQAWEDDSPPTSWRTRQAAHAPPPRRAKLRAQRQLYQASSAAEDSEALVEEALGNGNLHDDDDDKMSMSEQGTDDGSNRAPLSDMSLDDTQDTIIAVREHDNNGSGSEDEDSESELSELDEPSENEVQASPSKVRRLRNGKVRYPTTPTAEKSQAAAQLMPDDEESDEDDDGPDLSLSSLSKLKRDNLIQMCQGLNIEYSKDATRAILIEHLLAHQNRLPPDSARTTRPIDSAASTRTMRPGGSNGRGSKAKGDSDVPLLLRSGSMPAQSEKPGTPVPSQQGEEELNGLDLESLDLVDKEIPFSKLEKMEKIGSGGFKDVYVGKYHITKKTSKKVAICDIRDQLSDMDIKELTLLRDLKHENIVRFIGVSIPPPEMRLTPCMIVSELCSNGDLYDYIRNTDPPPDQDIFRILLETARGLEYLHTRTPAIIHRDCKSTNVLVTRNKTAKINDFGLARVRNNKRSMIKSLVGTVNWQAVELWQPKPSYNEKVDVWSAGMTFWETLQWHQPEKKYPFQDMNEHQIYQDVGQRKLRPPTISIRRHYGSEIVDLLDRMWDHNPKERPTMTEVCTELEALVAMKREAAAEKAAAAAADDGALDAAGRRGSHANGLRKTSR